MNTKTLKIYIYCLLLIGIQKNRATTICDLENLLPKETQINNCNNITFESNAPFQLNVTNTGGVSTVGYILNPSQCSIPTPSAEISISSDWITRVDHLSQIGKGLLHIYVNPNRNLFPRQTAVTLKYHNPDNGGSGIDIYFTVIITQAAGVAYYVDSDGDGWGDYSETPFYGTDFDTPPPGWVSRAGDICPTVPGPNKGCPFSIPADDKNWINTRSFDITGKAIGQTHAYFDELGKATQTFSWDFKSKKIWANETRYDHQGRPALHTLSAPIGESPWLSGETTPEPGYQDDFIKKSNGDPYLISDYEKTDIENPSPVGAQANSLGWYYSNNNSSDRFQDVTNRPYSRTIYSELNPGTVLKTIGGNKMDDQWKNEYVFSMPAGQELSKPGAFGDNAYNDYKVIKTVARDVHGVESVVFTDTDGRTLAAARSGNEQGNPDNTRTASVKIGEQGYVDIHIPVGRIGITVTGRYASGTQVFDLITEKLVTINKQDLPPGFYRIAFPNPESYIPDSVTVTYPENYYDYSLNEYDKAGRLLSSKQPLQHLESIFEYNALGQLTHTHSPDEGDAWFKYRSDGQIRFSQNSKQKITVSEFNGTEEFSYTNYDDKGRPIESGVFYGAPKRVLFDDLNPDDFIPIGFRKEVHKTTYDFISETDKDFLSGIHSRYANPSFLAGNVAKTENDNTTTYYSYDIYGRVQWIIQDIAGLGAKTIDYVYDPVSSQVNQVLYQKGKEDQFIHRYTYDPDDYRLTKVETSTSGTNYTEHASYEYTETGQLKTLNLAKGLQEIDYVYTLNGALKSINHPSLDANGDPGNDSNDLFGMTLHYYNNDYARPNAIPKTSAGINQYNGNIKAITWNTNRPDMATTPSTYYYEYNKNNWLQGASFNKAITEGEGNIAPTATRNQQVTTSETVEVSEAITLAPGFSVTATTALSFEAKIRYPGSVSDEEDYNVYGITYDANGNIQTLNRNKNNAHGSNAMDKLSYAYKTAKPNQLLRVDDAVGTITDADDIEDQDGDNYIYNEIGQLIENKEEKITYLYNASGLVTEVRKNNNPLVKFFYNDKNHRVRKESYNPTNGNLSYTEHYVRDAGGTTIAIYRDQLPIHLTIYGASRLGIYNRVDGSSKYELTDHLGNVRAVVGRDRQGISLQQYGQTDYYPFGMPMPNRNLKGDYRYAYQGQEVDPETGKEAFQLRLWDSRIGRWLTTDPAGQYNSPYLGMGNNPITMVDPDGGFSCPDPPCNGGNLPPGSHTLIGDDGFVSGDTFYGGDLGEVLITANTNLAGAPRLIPQAPMRVIPGGGGLQNPSPLPGFFATLYMGKQMIDLFSSFENPIYNMPKSDYDKPEDESKLYLYRAMRMSNGMPEIGDESLAQLGIRTKDVNGAGPNTHIFPSELMGMSVTPWNGAITYPPPTANKPLWRIHIVKLQIHGLSFFQDGPTHGVVIPSNHTSLTNFRTRVHSTAPYWERAN
ncbi:RHS repeat domain-containing protein [Aquimarina sp. RZ0]|uniref:RHS repeat domain-containing protein n=1 Tax=Aquimarina sp. RZ0 TaxID=2607730 RepID=UPI0011F18EC2|nr:RHS repeat-associated core domain-containing protein [Aquimarina sp. RZ0]KAA1246527.1 RHS repeat-associated core domain-containing protein [Aquimarina sp. RZ0]